MQRELVSGLNVVCEGRDIGSVVFPKADFKFYLHADIESRVNRRYNQLYQKKNIISKENIKQSIILRDFNDINRLNSPLKKVKDSIEIDTTNLTIDEQIEKIVNIINKK